MRYGAVMFRCEPGVEASGLRYRGGGVPARARGRDFGLAVWGGDVPAKRERTVRAIRAVLPYETYLNSNLRIFKCQM